jgi:hypothetical protein
MLSKGIGSGGTPKATGKVRVALLGILEPQCLTGSPLFRRRRVVVAYRVPRRTGERRGSCHNEGECSVNLGQNGIV